LAALSRSPRALGLPGGRYTAVSTLPADDIRGQARKWPRWFIDGHPTFDCLQRIDAVRDVLTTGGRTIAHWGIAWTWARHTRSIALAGFRHDPS
jgi:aryl-alcohol dehydrogenase-like predicted oxidoreductase